ncbi:hypothetical protein [Polluticaenibacter yanchengensis]|uniref:Uncharacterized protein n=1 Tax=Polluticaenibacter yanchengensis TaxID=3014562 RepID=A0ABT4ULD3_9BACT|nr:hypothetical protein [Chitinophagaceae bacterium LY-5]
MKRKKFISTLLLAIPTFSFAKVFSFGEKTGNEGKPSKKGFIVKADC